MNGPPIRPPVRRRGRRTLLYLLLAGACADSTTSTEPTLPPESSARLVVAFNPIAPAPAGARLAIEPFVIRYGDGVVQRPAGWTRPLPASGAPIALPIDLRACLDDPYWRTTGLRPVCEAGAVVRYVLGGLVRDEVRVSASYVGAGDSPALPEAVRLSLAPRVTFVEGPDVGEAIPAEGIRMDRLRPGAPTSRFIRAIVRDSATNQELDRRVTWTMLDRGLAAPGGPVFERYVRLEPGSALGTFRLQAAIGQAAAVLPVRVTPRLLVARLLIEGPGGGRVTAPTGFSCEHPFRDTVTRCTVNYDEDSRPVLTATPLTGSLFDSWQYGCDAVSGVECTLPVVASETRVRFVPARAVTTVTLTGPGTASGTIVASNGERCSIARTETSRTCTFSRPWRDTLVITPAADAGSRFEGFTGACDGAFFGQAQPTCLLRPAVEGPVFSRIVPDITPVTIAPATGTTTTARVVSLDGRLDCVVGPTTASGRCAADYRAADTLTLDVDSSEGAIAASWDGTCIATSTTRCAVQVGLRGAIRPRLVSSHEITLVLSPGNGGVFALVHLDGTALDPTPSSCRATSVLTADLTCRYRLPRGSTYSIGAQSALVSTRVRFEGVCGPRSTISSCEVRVDRDQTIRVLWENQP